MLRCQFRPFSEIPDARLSIAASRAETECFEDIKTVTGRTGDGAGPRGEATITLGAVTDSSCSQTRVAAAFLPSAMFMASRMHIFFEFPLPPPPSAPLPTARDAFCVLDAVAADL